MPEHDDNPPDAYVPWTPLARYLAGECDPSEKAAVAHWIAADPANARVLDELSQIWAASETPAAKLDVEAFLRRVKRGRPPLRLADDGTLLAATPLRRPVRITPLDTPVPARRRRWATLLAAAVAGGLLVWTWRSAPFLLFHAPATLQRGIVTGERQQLMARSDDDARSQRDVTPDGEAVSRCLP
jgi:ferric-dicitrate binding protein FerR (iron transport regulator)